MAGKDTKWPRPPDPRGGHYSTRGVDPPYASYWKYKVTCPTAESVLTFLVKGIVLTHKEGDATYNVWEFDDGFPFGPLFSLVTYRSQGADATALGYSVESTFTIQWTPVAAAFATSYLLWPPGPFVPPPITLNENIAFPLNDLNGPVFFQGAEWDFPPGYVL